MKLTHNPRQYLMQDIEFFIALYPYPKEIRNSILKLAEEQRSLPLERFMRELR